MKEVSYIRELGKGRVLIIPKEVRKKLTEGKKYKISFQEVNL